MTSGPGSKAEKEVLGTKLTSITSLTNLIPRVLVYFLTEGARAERFWIYGIINYFLNGRLRKISDIKSVTHYISVLISNMCTKTGTPRPWENDYHHPRVSPGTHPLIKKLKPEDSGYKLDTLAHLI